VKRITEYDSFEALLDHEDTVASAEISASRGTNYWPLSGRYTPATQNDASGAPVVGFQVRICTP
jgi:hypothetical protein